MSRRQEPVDEVGGARVQYSSRDAAALRRKRDVEASREWYRFAMVTLSAAVLYLGVMTMASGRWTRSDAPTITTLPSAASGTNRTYAAYTDIGFWEICSCTLSADPTFFCPAESRAAHAQAALMVLPAMLGIGTVVVVALDAFVLEDVVWPSYAAAGLSGGAAVSNIAAWAVVIGRYSSSSVCGSASRGASEYGIVQRLLALAGTPGAAEVSYGDAGLVLHWGFGFMVIETVLLAILATLFVLRARQVVRLWALVFGSALVLPILLVVSASTNYSIASSGLSTSGDENFNVGAWAACSCRAVTAACGDSANSYRAIQAFAVIRLILQVVQIAVVGVIVPTMGGFVPRWVPPAVGWVAWVASLLTWTIAVGTFSSCGCGDVHAGQAFDWPFAFDFTAFILQTAVAGQLSWRYARRQLLEWAVHEHARTAAAANAIPPTAAAPRSSRFASGGGSADPTNSRELRAFDPYGTESDASDVAGSPRRDASPAGTELRMAPRVTVTRRKGAPDGGRTGGEL
jgi:hypothetical protein